MSRNLLRTPCTLQMTALACGVAGPAQHREKAALADGRRRRTGSWLLWEEEARLPHGARKLDGAVAVGVHHPLVERVDDQRPRDAVEEVDVRVRDGVLPVVGVHHAHDVVEGVAPRRPLVAPVDVLRLLEHRHVALLLRHAPRRVARRQDAGKLGGVDAVVEGDSDPRVAPQLLPHPLANEGLLVLLACKGHITGEEKLLIFSRYPRHAQCDSVLLRPLLQIHSSKEWVH
mmetsp:Transcript_56903/g.149900  ORF Transcript_56903/g.149900 Transcript_56903/m.149900 type:complete len:230 (-) Transcript_56903:178-867(-)